jgi:hypothetical protein
MENKMVDNPLDEQGFYRAQRPPVELNDDIDKSKLSAAELEMLEQLEGNTAKDQSKVFPPSLTQSDPVGVPESVVLTPKDDTATVASREAAPLGLAVEEEPELPPMSAEAASEAPELPPEAPELPPLVDEDEAPGAMDDPPPLSAGGSTPHENCPHCGWDLKSPTVQEPSYDEKMGFLQSVLGQRTFVNQYEIFGGAVTVRFRTLTTKEMDVIYSQVFHEREAGIVTTVQDYWEKVNRYRLYLQLVYLAAKDGSFTHQLPYGYSEDTNPHAESYYEFEPETPDGTFLAKVENHILENVLRTESIQRTTNTLCARFNRLLSKLEALVDNSDFWKATGEQS